MYRKKLVKACLVTALAVPLAATSMSTVLPGQAAVVQAAGPSIVKVVFVDENGKNAGGGDFFVDADGDGMFNYSELTLPEGYELNGGGDEFLGKDSYTLKHNKIKTANNSKI